MKVPPFPAASALEQRPEGVGVEDILERVGVEDILDILEVLPVDHFPHYDSTPLDMPVPPLERGDLGIQRHLIVEVVEPVFADGQESQGAVQPTPFVQHEEPVLPPAARVRGRVSRSRRRFAHLLAEEGSTSEHRPQKWMYGSFEYSSSSDSYDDTTCSESDSSDDDFRTSTVPEFSSGKEDKGEPSDEFGVSTYVEEEGPTYLEEEEEFDLVWAANTITSPLARECLRRLTCVGYDADDEETGACGLWC